jgi:CHAD domain-containing protein
VPAPAVKAVAASAAVAAGGAIAAGKLVRERAERAESRRARRYRLHDDEGIADGLRRVVRGQIDLAIERLRGAEPGELAESIHEARKALKRVRAVLRLVRDALGEETYQQENATFRDAGRELSAVRDSQVMVQTLDGLTERYADEIPDGALAGLREALARDAQAANERVLEDTAIIARVLGMLSAARTRVATWRLPEDDGLSAVASGFERIYKRGRRARRAARKHTTTETLHQLRKRAKDLRYDAQVLRTVAPKQMKKLGRRADRIADVVGEDHDLAVLLGRARELPEALRRGELELLSGLIERRRRRLQREALKCSGRVYKSKPGKLAAE